MIKFKFVRGEDGYEQSKEFRNEILQLEMNYPEAHDEHDGDAFHIIGRENDIIICYGRMYRVSDYAFVIDKVCVNPDDRRQYVADTILRALEDRAVCEIGAIIYVTVPDEAREFFEHEDYIAICEPFEENSITYTKMKKDLTKVRGCRGGCHK